MITLTIEIAATDTHAGVSMQIQGTAEHEIEIQLARKFRSTIERYLLEQQDAIQEDMPADKSAKDCLHSRLNKLN